MKLFCPFAALHCSFQIKFTELMMKILPFGVHYSTPFLWHYPVAYLRALVHSELGLFVGECFVAAEVFAVEQCERVVGVALGRQRWIAQDEEHTQRLVVGPRERDGPPVVAVVEVLGRGVAVQVSGHRLGHDEREDARVVVVVQLGEPVQQSHCEQSELAKLSFGSVGALALRLVSFIRFRRLSSWHYFTVKNVCASDKMLRH